MRTLDQMPLRELSEHELNGVTALAELARRASAEPIRFQAALNLIGFDAHRREEARQAERDAVADGMPRAVAERIVALEEKLTELEALDGAVIELPDAMTAQVAEIIAETVAPLMARITELEELLTPCGFNGCSTIRAMMPHGCSIEGCGLALHADTATDEGRRDRLRGIPENANPYRTDGIEPDALKAAAWLDGWRAEG